jgi:superfamily II DNA or RNA helicase
MPNSPDYSYQDTAVECIANDFAENPWINTLLVIPTGGGKTRTAIKSILRLHDDGFFSDSSGRILWVAHRDELLQQAKDAFSDEVAHSRAKEAFARTSFESNITAGKKILENDAIKLVVIDEAHHAAASTYLPLFRPQVAVLGLTATPSRHDNKPLEFERESFSIGFPDLIDRGVILKPNVIQLAGGSSNLTGFTEPEMEVLNNVERNTLIREALLANRDKLDKIIVYVGTKKHAKDLCQFLKDSSLSSHYESISYVLGGDGHNSRGQTRKGFFEQEKGYTRSIIVNVQVLTEGYDDPKVNAVVMAAPTRSKLTYMQCMGRAVRRDPSRIDKTAYVIEIVEVLPNIQYHIDNRWIYSELADLLEPRIIDRTYHDAAGLRAELTEIYEKANVPKSERSFLDQPHGERPQLLLFKYVTASREIGHEAILLTRENRRFIQNWFNFFSNRIFSGRFKDTNWEAAMNMVRHWWGDELSKGSRRHNIWDALQNSLSHKDPDNPWITLYTFRLMENEPPQSDALLDFLQDVTNSEEIQLKVAELHDQDSHSVLKFPLPIRGFYGCVLKRSDVDRVNVLLNDLNMSPDDAIKQIESVCSSLAFCSIPIGSALLTSVPQIVRFNLPYRFDLNQDHASNQT